MDNKIQVSVPDTSGYIRTFSFSDSTEMKAFIEECRTYAVDAYDEAAKSVGLDSIKENPQAYYAARDARDILNVSASSFWSIQFVDLHKAATFAAIQDVRWNTFQTWVHTIQLLVDSYQKTRKEEKEKKKEAAAATAPISPQIKKLFIGLEATESEIQQIAEELIQPCLDAKWDPPTGEEVRDLIKLVRYKPEKFKELVQRIRKRTQDNNPQL